MGENIFLLSVLCCGGGILVFTLLLVLPGSRGTPASIHQLEDLLECHNRGGDKILESSGWFDTYKSPQEAVQDWQAKLNNYYARHPVKQERPARQPRATGQVVYGGKYKP